MARGGKTNPPKKAGSFNHLHSLKRTFSPLKIGHPKRKLVFLVFQPSILRCHVSFREGTTYSPCLLPIFQELSNIPWNIPQTPNQEFMKGFLSFGGERGFMGYAPGVCWGSLRNMLPYLPSFTGTNFYLNCFRDPKLGADFKGLSS